MKVLFVASNPRRGSGLDLEAEISDLQHRASQASGEPVRFLFRPQLAIEELQATLFHERPQVLHIAAHGSRDMLELANSRRKPVPVTAELLRAFLDYDNPPTLVYINACNSQDLAEALTSAVPVTIGTTALIENDTARKAAVAFYEKMFAGASVSRAFEISKALMECLQDRNVSCKLFVSKGVDPKTLHLYSAPRLVAKDVQLRRDGIVQANFLIIGCPSNVVQVVVFSDDSDVNGDWSKKRDEDISEYLSRRLTHTFRGSARYGVFELGHLWWERFDYRVHACCSTNDGEVRVVSSTLCQAIGDYCRLVPHASTKKNSESAAKIVRHLRGRRRSVPA